MNDLFTAPLRGRTVQGRGRGKSNVFRGAANFLWYRGHGAAPHCRKILLKKLRRIVHILHHHFERLKALWDCEIIVQSNEHVHRANTNAHVEKGTFVRFRECEQYAGIRLWSPLLFHVKFHRPTHHCSYCSYHS